MHATFTVVIITYYRGNSKYHYYGIRIKPDSPLNTFPQDDSPVVAMRQPTQSSATYECMRVCGVCVCLFVCVCVCRLINRSHFYTVNLNVDHTLQPC